MSPDSRAILQRWPRRPRTVFHRSRPTLNSTPRGPSHHTRGPFSQDSCFSGVVWRIRWLSPNGRPTAFRGRGLAVVLPFSKMAGSLKGSAGRSYLDGRDESWDSFPSCPSSVPPLHLPRRTRSARNLLVKPAQTASKLNRSLPSPPLQGFQTSELEVVQVAEGGRGDFPIVLQQQAVQAARV